MGHRDDALPIDLDDAVSHADASPLGDPTAHKAADLDGWGVERAGYQEDVLY